MNKYREIVKRPRYSMAAQFYANDLPIWTKARDDRFSNWQSIFTDVTLPVVDMSNYIRSLAQKQTIMGSDCTDSEYLYKYVTSNLEYIQLEDIKEFIEESEVQGIGGETGGVETIVSVQVPAVEDLVNRLPFKIKNEESTITAIEVIEDNLDSSWPNKKIYFTVNKRCYLGFYMSPKEGYSYEDLYKAEEFYYLQKRSPISQGYFTRSRVYLRTINEEDIGSLDLLPLREQKFGNAIQEGQYYLEFDLISDTQLDNYNITLCANGHSPISNKIQSAPVFIDKNAFSYLCHYEINGEYLQIVNKALISDADDQILHTFLLTEEEDQSLVPVTLESWAKKENILFGKLNNKLYMYDLFMNANEYIYSDNDSFFCDLVCDEIDYKPDDEIYVETRIIKVPTDFKILGARLKINNKESGEEYYIDRFGEISQSGSWRSFAENSNAIENINMLKWKVTLPYIGSYKFTLEVVTSDNNIVIAGEKNILVDYKVPFRTLTLSENYEGYLLGVNPDGFLELFNEDTKDTIRINFWKDGYYLDKEANYAWTNAIFNQLNIAYEA